MVTFTDDFNRANGSIGANYVIEVGQDLLIISNRVSADGALSSRAFACVDSWTGGNDHYAQAKTESGSGTLGTNGFAGALVRVDETQPSENFYLLGKEGTGFGVYIRNNGIYTTLGSGVGLNPNDPTIIRLTADGSTLTYEEINGDSGSYTNTVLTSGSPGLYCDQNVWLDNFEAGDLSAPSGVTGTAATTLPTVTAAASGTRTIPQVTGTAATTLPTVTAAASGTRTIPQVTGTAATTLPTVAAAASGTRTIPQVTGTASVTLPVVTVSATGTVVVAITGTGAVVLPVMVASAASVAVLWSVWDGQTEQPAVTVAVWDGTSEQPAQGYEVTA